MFRNIIIENEVTLKEIKKIIIIVVLLNIIILEMIIISLIVLIVGGAEILIAININHQNTILGDIEINPLKDKIFREWYLIYMSFTSKNNADEDKPWAIIIRILPNIPVFLIEKIPIKTSPIWATEE